MRSRRNPRPGLGEIDGLTREQQKSGFVVVVLPAPGSMKLDEVGATLVDEIAPFLGGLVEPAEGLRFGHGEDPVLDRISTSMVSLHEYRRNRRVRLGSYCSRISYNPSAVELWERTASGIDRDPPWRKNRPARRGGAGRAALIGARGSGGQRRSELLAATKPLQTISRGSREKVHAGYTFFVFRQRKPP
jgi:hypothetical protein